MGKAVITKRLAMVLLIIVAPISSILAQTNDDFSDIDADAIFSWKSVETTDPSSQSAIQFIPRTDITPVSWDFGDSNTSTEASPTHTYSYTSWDDSITVTLSYTLNGTNLTEARDIPLSPAYFWPLNDKNLGQLATFKWVFCSNYRIQNESTGLGNLHFSWSIDGTALGGNSFTPPTLGQWPNIYYTFENGGTHQVKLEVYNTSAPLNVAEFTQTISLNPDFTATKEKLTNIPNVFTPNGDGVNDVFIVQTSGTAQFVLRIISRSGALLYKNKSSIIQWDGRNNQGDKLPEGIYYYIIEDLSGLYESATGFVYIYKGDK